VSKQASAHTHARTHAHTRYNLASPYNAAPLFISSKMNNLNLNEIREANAKAFEAEERAAAAEGRRPRVSGLYPVSIFDRAARDTAWAKVEKKDATPVCVMEYGEVFRNHVPGEMANFFEGLFTAAAPLDERMWKIKFPFDDSSLPATYPDPRKDWFAYHSIRCIARVMFFDDRDTAWPRIISTLPTIGIKRMLALDLPHWVTSGKAMMRDELKRRVRESVEYTRADVEGFLRGDQRGPSMASERVKEARAKVPHLDKLVSSFLQLEMNGSLEQRRAIDRATNREPVHGLHVMSIFSQTSRDIAWKVLQDMPADIPKMSDECMAYSRLFRPAVFTANGPASVAFVFEPRLWKKWQWPAPQAPVPVAEPADPARDAIAEHAFLSMSALVWGSGGGAILTTAILDAIPHVILARIQAALIFNPSLTTLARGPGPVREQRRILPALIDVQMARRERDARKGRALFERVDMAGFMQDAPKGPGLPRDLALEVGSWVTSRINPKAPQSMLTLHQKRQDAHWLIAHRRLRDKPAPSEDDAPADKKARKQ
jgi:hypothetical protein